MKVFGFENVTRVTVVSADGVRFEDYNFYPSGVELHLQDDGRTLKLFPLSRARADEHFQREEQA